MAGIAARCPAWELSERGLTVVDPSTLVVTFGPLATTAQSELNEELERHRETIGQTFGEASFRAFHEAEPLDAAILLQSFHAQRAQALEEQLASTRRALAASSGAKLGEKERGELERLRAQKKERAARGKARNRANASRGGKRKKKK
jgi:hypothetical protein